VPPCAAPRCALAHGLQLGGDLQQGAVGRGGRDVGDEPDETVVTALAPSAIGRRRSTVQVPA
jgi:hypothetical protein